MSRGGRTHAVRNTYGHIEYLTDDEVANLRERGEDVEVVGTYRGRPPIANNPANQEYVNELWREQQEKKRKGRKKGPVGKVAGGIVTTGLIASALGGSAAHPQQQSDTARQHYGQSSLEGQKRRRGGQASDATRDKGDRDHGTNQR